MVGDLGRKRKKGLWMDVVGTYWRFPFYGVGELGGTSWGCRLSYVCGLGREKKKGLWMDVVGT